MLSFLLFRQIVILFLLMLAGVVLVKTRLLKKDDNKIPLVILMNFAVPCVTINAFLKVGFSSEIRNGLLLTAATVAVVQALLIVITKLSSRPLRLNMIEQGSLEYSNSGAFMIPLITAVLGGEWVVYTATYLCVQNFFLWTHGISLISETPQYNLKKLVTNPNLIATVLGLLIFLLRIPVPEILQETLGSAGNLVGPLAMICTGMIMAEADLKKVFGNSRIYFILLLKMIVLPLLVLAALKYLPLTWITPHAHEIMLIIVMVVAAPSANLITQWSALYDKYADYAGAIGIATQLLCIFTMPFIVFLYEL